MSEFGQKLTRQRDPATTPASSRSSGSTHTLPLSPTRTAFPTEELEGEMTSVSLDESEPRGQSKDNNNNHHHHVDNGFDDDDTGGDIGAAGGGIGPIGLGLDENEGEIDLSSPVTATGTPAPGQLARTPSPRSSVSSRRHQNISPIPTRSSTDSRTSLSRRDTNNSSSANVASSSKGVSSPRLVTSPRFRSVEVPLASLAAQATSAVSNDGAGAELLRVDEGAPFESIALDIDGPPPAPLPAQVGHGRKQSHSTKSKRDSWKRDSITNIKELKLNVAGGGVSLAVQPPPENGGAGISASSSPGPGAIGASARGAASSISAPVSGTSTPRRHAPPAHPHPFPVPSTPNSPHVNNISSPALQVPTPIAPPTNVPVHGIGVKGVSTLDKFISRTRPQHLPPKSRGEDLEHLHEWEGMMAKSRDHEQERRKHDEIKRLEKERHIISITAKWETLLNDPDFSVQKIRSNIISRKLWFEGVPPRLRGQAWAQAIGNPLALNKDVYKTYLRRAQKAQAQGRFPQNVLDQLEADLDSTLQTMHVFHQGSPMRQELKDLVSAWVVYRSDSARGYAPYITHIAGMFLLASNPTVAFLSLVNFLSRPTMSAFYNNVTDEIDAFYRVFENLQADMFPRIFANCKNLGLRLPESYFRSALVEQVPFAVACRLWDQIVLEGDQYIFRASLAIFGFLEPRLYFPDREEILSVLEGRNSATNAITEREKERAKLRGEEYEEALDGKLSVFGLQEEALFEWLDNDGWKESRFDRLVTRELPD